MLYIAGIRYNNDICSQIVHLMFVECSICVGYNISKKSKWFLHHVMSPVTVLTGR